MVQLMNFKQWGIGAGIGIGTGLLISSVMTFIDWYINPGELFHKAGAANWAIILETASSWFFPVAGIAIPIAWAVIFLRTRMH
jgi:hypothetical protein